MSELEPTTPPEEVLKMSPEKLIKTAREDLLENKGTDRWTLIDWQLLIVLELKEIKRLLDGPKFK